MSTNLLGRVPCSFSSPRLGWGTISGKGRCAICLDTFEPGDLIAVWGGLVISLTDALELPDRDLSQCVLVEEGLVLWTAGLAQSAADWINHSCDPNAGIRGQVSIVAMRRIHPGEEVCIDYAMCPTPRADDFSCACGSPRCRGHVSSDDWLLPEIQQRYRGFVSNVVVDRLARQEERKTCGSSVER